MRRLTRRPCPTPRLQAFRAEPRGPLLAVYPARPAPGSTEPRFVASIMSVERVSAYRALAVQAGFAAVNRLMAASAPTSHWFLVPAHGFGSSAPAPIDHLKARAAFVAQADQRLQALLAAEQLEEV